MKHENPFQHADYSDHRDEELITAALRGDRTRLSELVKKHQGYIFNVALKMVNNVADAEDITQEILVKLVTQLGKYDATKGKFRTWLYRITFHHFLNLQKQPYERVATDFDTFFERIEHSATEELSAQEEQERQLQIEESKVACMAGMLMCLDREQRLTYIVGEVFEIDHRLAADIFDIKPDNFRKKLSRARQDLHQWMHRRCGLVNRANPCRCPKKTKGFIANGWVDADSSKWHSHYKHRIEELSARKVDDTLRTIDEIYARLYRDHPFKIPQRTENIVEEVIGNGQLRDIFKLKG